MSARILVGDCLDSLKTLPAGSVQCCVTSPPYWGLRDYGQDRQHGLEETPGAYVANLVQVFAEVRRVLRDDGTVWLNLGDSYTATSRGGDSSTYKTRDEHRKGKAADLFGGDSRRVAMPAGLKTKDLVGIPWRVAFALQADGWYLRSDIIWHKPNPMPESVRDRPTKGHEYVFLLSKRPRYFYDIEAVREDPKPSNAGRMSAPKCGPERVLGTANQTRKIYAEIKGANRRTVWSIPSKPYTGAHFATMPPELARLCILAGTSQGGACSACGAPWVRVVERTPMEVRPSPRRMDWQTDQTRTQTGGTMTKPPTSETVGWSAGCECGADVAPCVVLDPYAGAGTTGLVAAKLRRDFIGCELNPDYAALAESRLWGDAPLFADVAVE
jgi:DNA modification methylase